jgi:hypothetical protein
MPTVKQMQKAPPLADIFRYIGMPSIYDSQINASQSGAPAAAANPYSMTQGYYTTEQQGGGEGGAQDVQVWHPPVLNENSNVPDAMKGIMQYDPNVVGKEGRNDVFRLNKSMIDKFPKTRFGDVSNVASMGFGAEPGAVQGTYGQTDLMNPGAKVWDENYGWITPKANLGNKKEARNDAITNGIIQSIMSFGMGPMGILPGGGIPGLASAAVGATKTFADSGNWKQALLNIAPGLIGAGLGGAGLKLPPELIQALKYGKQAYGLYGAAKNHNPVSAGMSLAQMARMFGG